MKTQDRDPRKNPKYGDRIAKVETNAAGVTMVNSRTVMATYEDNGEIWVVWTRKYRKRGRGIVECRCPVSKWRQWARGARVCEDNLMGK